MYYIIPLLIALFTNTISAYYVRQHAEKRLQSPYTPLPDLLHDFFPKIPVFIPDYFLFLCFVGLSYIEIDKFETNMLTVGLCGILRSFTIWFTIMPTCMPQTPLKSIFHNTHDLMFSGHTLFFIGIGKMLNSTLIPIVGAFLLVLSRQHYTIDVIVSGLVYNTVYHYITNMTY